MARQQDDFIRTALRVPPDLHALIHAAAEENGRTFNSEIVERLKASFSTEPLEARVAKLESAVLRKGK